MINIDRAPKPKHPALFNKVIGQVQDNLLKGLPWLNYAFGAAYTKRKDDEVTPMVRLWPSDEYFDVRPSDTYGNTSFFLLKEDNEYQGSQDQFGMLKTDFSIIFWLNLDDVKGEVPTGEEDEEGNPVYEQVDVDDQFAKAQILDVLVRENPVSVGKVSFDKVYSSPKDVYEGFDISKIDPSIIMAPYTAFRFSGVMEVYEDCKIL